MPREYLLPERLRKTLARPLGRLFTVEEIASGELSDSIARASFVVTVGDKVTETSAKMGRAPDVQIVDGRENRKARKPPVVSHAVLVKVSNPPGTITEEAIGAIRTAFAGKKPARVLVDGEEDLLAIPAVLFAPLGASVYYGQPGEGVVLVRSDSRSKSRSRALMAEMGIQGPI